MFKLEPLTFVVCDYELPINSNFQTVLDSLESKDTTELIKMLCPALLDVLHVLMVDGVLTNDEANNKLILFMTYINKELFGLSKDDVDNNEPLIIDFKQDQAAIAASFMKYGINLYQVQDLDYRMFIQLLSNLHDTKMNEIWEIRTMPIPTGKGSAKHREQVLKAKAAYAIKSDNDMSDDDLINIANQLANDFMELEGVE